jgi:hypothetical protein
MRPPNGGTTGSVILTMGPTATAGSAEINLNAIGGGVGNGIINSTAPLELRRSGTTVATVNTNALQLALSKSLLFTGAATPNYSISQGNETIGGSSTNALFLGPSSVAASNVVIAATTVGNAALWLRPNSTGSGVGIVGTVNDLDFVLRRNQNNYLRLGSSNAITTAIQNGTAGTLYPAYFARTWVNFNGTGTVAIRASGNVTSITDNGVGDYTVNFTTAMPDANYATVFGGYNATNAYNVIQVNSATAPTTSAVRIASVTQQSGVPTATDVAYVNVAVLR